MLFYLEEDLHFTNVVTCLKRKYIIIFQMRDDHVEKTTD